MKNKEKKSEIDIDKLTKEDRRLLLSRYFDEIYNINNIGFSGYALFISVISLLTSIGLALYPLLKEHIYIYAIVVLCILIILSKWSKSYKPLQKILEERRDLSIEKYNKLFEKHFKYAKSKSGKK